MTSGYHRRLHILEAVFTNVNLGQPSILLWVRRRIPSVHLIPTHLQLADTILLLVTQTIMCRHLVILTSTQFAALRQHA